MRFKTLYYTEKIQYPNSDDFIKISKEAISQIKKLKFDNVDIFWRGFKIKKIAAPVLRISGDDRQSDFRGGSLEGPNAMIKILGIKNPAFARQDQTVSVFGSPMVMVPIKPFDSWQSPLVDDLADLSNEKDLEKISKTYKNTTKNLGKETIFDIKKYLLVNINQLLFTMGRKFGDIKGLKKYKDVITLLEDYINYINKLKG